MIVTPQIIPITERPLMSTSVACNFLSIGKTKLYELLEAGSIASIKRGSRRYIFTDSVLSLVDSWRTETLEKSQ